MIADQHFDWQSVEPDYTPEYVAGLRRMTGAEKLAVAGALYRSALSVKMAGLRRRHPEWDEPQLRHEAARRIMLSSAAA